MLRAIAVAASGAQQPPASGLVALQEPVPPFAIDVYVPDMLLVPDGLRSQRAA